MIYTKLLFPELGEGETWTREVDGRVLEGVFPFQEYETSLLELADRPICSTRTPRNRRSLNASRRAAPRP